MRKIAALAALSLAAAFAACATGTPTPEEPDDRGEPYLTVAALAERLNLRLVVNSPRRAALEGPGNTITIFPEPARFAYVNGRALGPVSGILPMGATIAVPVALVPRFRAALRPPTVTATPPRPAPAPPPVAPPPPAPKGLAGVRIVIDPGHGGKDPGAKSTIGVWEKVLNLAVGTRLAGELEALGANVVMTRRGDSFVELEERAAIANRFQAAVFVSLHADSSPKPSTRGFTLYVARSASPESNRLATAILAALAGQGIESRGIKQADYRVLVKTRMPAVLVEMGYLSNATEARLLTTEAMQRKIASAIARGIESGISAR